MLWPRASTILCISLLISQVACNGNGVPPECFAIKDFTPIAPTSDGVELKWKPKAHPSNRMWIQYSRQFSAEFTAFDNINIDAFVTVTPSAYPQRGTHAIHLRVLLSPMEMHLQVSTWPHLSFNFIDYPGGSMRSLLTLGKRECQNTYYTNDPKIHVGVVYVFQT